MLDDFVPNPESANSCCKRVRFSFFLVLRLLLVFGDFFFCLYFVSFHYGCYGRSGKISAPW